MGGVSGASCSDRLRVSSFFSAKQHMTVDATIFPERLGQFSLNFVPIAYLKTIILDELVTSGRLCG